MWSHYISKNHPLSYISLVDAVMLHHAVLYNPNLRNLDLDGKVNDEGVYHNFVSGNNISTLHCYQVRKMGEARKEREVKTGCFGSKLLYNTFTQKLDLEA